MADRSKRRDAAFYLIAKEVRPWANVTTPTRFVPGRYAHLPPWLEDEESALVERETHNGYVELVERQGYGHALQLKANLKKRFERWKSERARFNEGAEDAKQIWFHVNRLGKKYGMEQAISGAEEGLRELDKGADHAEWFDTISGATLNGYARSGRVAYPMLRVDVTETWEQAVKEAHKEMEDWKARAQSVNNTVLLLLYRLDALDDVLREYEMYGAVLTWEEVQEATGTGTLAAGEEKPPFNRRHLPRYDWLCDEYVAIRAKAEEDEKPLSKSKARHEVVARYQAEFGDSLRKLYGKDKAGEIDERTVRNALWHGIERGRKDYAAEDI